MKRRTFLRQTGVALAALGMSEAGLFALGDRYHAALALPTRRKLALLIGINQYPEQVCDYPVTAGNALNGCLTDVELQQELLQYRYGFQPADILTVTDQQATRQNIVNAFQSHLREQSQTGDVVVIHLSGLGSRVRLGDSPQDERNAFVPVDGLLPTVNDPQLHDLLEETLGLLLRSLPTAQVTTILDLSFADLGKVLPSGIRVRTRPSTPNGQLSEAERLLQASLTNPAKKSSTELATWPGVVLSASQARQGAIEAQWSGFSAGLFTYALTQQLWQYTPPQTLYFAMNRATTAMNLLAGVTETPQIGGQKQQDSSLRPYNTTAETTIAAVGAVTSLNDDGKTVQVHLGGIAPLLLDYYGAGSLLSLTVPNSAEPLLLQVRSREGVRVKARLLEAAAFPTLQVGQLVEERLRVLPRNIGLWIALDPRLERIERVDATSAIATLPKIFAVATSEQPVDYIFGHYRSTASTLTAALPTTSDKADVNPPTVPSPSPNGYGLFNLMRSPLPNTIAQSDEAVRTAVNRLTPRLRSLLGLKLLRLTENSVSSRLPVRLSLESAAPQSQLILQQQTTITSKLFTPPLPTPHSPLPKLHFPSITYRLENLSNQPLYFTLLGINSNGNAIAFYPFAEPEANTLPPAGNLLIPQTIDAFDESVEEQTLTTELYFVCSTSPLKQTVTLLSEAGRSSNSSLRMGTVPNLLEVAQAVLQDLHQNSASTRPEQPNSELPTDTYSLNVEAWASLPCLYQ